MNKNVVLSDRKIRIAVVGCGRISKNTLSQSSIMMSN